MAAPALAAPMADCAICSGVTGTAGLRPGVSAEPVTAHEIITFRGMLLPPCASIFVAAKRSARTGLKPRGSHAQRLTAAEFKIADGMVECGSGCAGSEFRP